MEKAGKICAAGIALFITGFGTGVVMRSGKLRCTKLKREKEKKVDKEQLQQMELNSLKKEFEQYKGQNEELKKFKHRYAERLQMLKKSLKDRDDTLMVETIREIEGDLDEGLRGSRQLSNNLTINALLREFIERCEGEGIDIEARLYFPESKEVDSLQLYKVFTNLMESLWEFCHLYSNPQKKLYVRIESGRKSSWINVFILCDGGGNYTVIEKEEFLYELFAMENRMEWDFRSLHEMLEELGGFLEVVHKGGQGEVHIELHLPGQQND